jgi:hypothetical protein
MIYDGGGIAARTEHDPQIASSSRTAAAVLIELALSS